MGADLIMAVQVQFSFTNQYPKPYAFPPFIKMTYFCKKDMNRTLKVMVVVALVTVF